MIFVTDPTFHYSSGSAVGTGRILQIPSKRQRLKFNILDICTREKSRSLVFGADFCPTLQCIFFVSILLRNPFFPLWLIFEGMALSASRIFSFFSTCRSPRAYLRIEIYLSNIHLLSVLISVDDFQKW